ncbi:MAG: Nitrilotriacetate monooxygenase component B (EC [uncultured Campylobacterales bacterium]|uniref:Nitrilotriacetate monooxygenase component B (EC) n=1 Tax=uncultured Campylobacterales bacterium TaxID=352960 RepID=A0A6S6T1E0_9BACT|nr:MAG: Nitrilotriacetate monooxygenase component B (EC [uncultured Campylobacterales bacterium]
MNIDFSKLSGKDIYKVVSSTVIPRPIAWISTLNKEGVLNLAPFSYFIPLGAEYLIVAIGHKSSGEEKDTLNNIKETGLATISFVSTNTMEKMNLSSNELSSDISESKEYNIEMKSIDSAFPDMVSRSEGAFFCEFDRIVDMPHMTVPVILKIKKAYFQNNICDENYDIKMNNIARVGKSYAKLDNI